MVSTVMPLTVTTSLNEKGPASTDEELLDEVELDEATTEELLEDEEAAAEDDAFEDDEALVPEHPANVRIEERANIGINFVFIFLFPF